MEAKNIFFFLLLFAYCSCKCQGEACQATSPPALIDLSDPEIVSRVLEEEIRKQFWYYLQGAVLLDRT